MLLSFAKIYALDQYLRFDLFATSTDPNKPNVDKFYGGVQLEDWKRWVRQMNTISDENGKLIETEKERVKAEQEAINNPDETEEQKKERVGKVVGAIWQKMNAELVNKEHEVTLGSALAQLNIDHINKAEEEGRIAANLIADAEQTKELLSQFL